VLDARGRAANQQDRLEHVPEDQIEQPQQHGGDHAELMVLSISLVSSA
jgi:hypothetical protein